MDFVSHGLWGIILLKIFNQSKLLFAFIAGILPDIIPFAILFIQRILGFAPPVKGEISQMIVPQYAHTLYNFTHSLIIIAIVFLLIYLWKKKFYIWLLAWPLHILVDIPTHSKDFFPTPMFYPISDFTFNGIMWGNPYIFFPNWILILGAFGIIYRKNIQELFRTILKKIKS